MGVGDLLREEEAMAGDRVCWVVVGFGEDARRAETREGRHGERHLVRFEVLAGEVASLRHPDNLRARKLKGCGCNASPVAHISLYREQITDFPRVGRSWGGLEHEPSILRVEGRDRKSGRK